MLAHTITTDQARLRALELRDTFTHEPYCITVAAGTLLTAKGACDIAPDAAVDHHTAGGVITTMLPEGGNCPSILDTGGASLTDGTISLISENGTSQK